MSNRRLQVIGKLLPVAERPVVSVGRLNRIAIVIAINIIVSVTIKSAQFADWAT